MCETISGRGIVVKKIKNSIVSYVLLVALAMNFTVASPISANAADYQKSVISLQRNSVSSIDKSDWYVDYLGYNTVTTDSNTTYKNSPYSIKVVNNDYSVTEVKKDYKLKSNTYYRASAMVKCSNIKLDPNDENKNTGAFIGQSWSYKNSVPSNSKKWSKIEYSFYTGDSSEYTLSLKAGIWNGKCKGTIWFDNIKIEELKTTNKWNILTIFFTKAKGTGTLSSGQKVNIKSSYGKKTIDQNKKILNGLYDDMDKVSGGLMDVKNIDYKVSDLKLKKFKSYDYTDAYGVNIHGLQYDLQNAKVVKEIRRLIGKKTYQQIILIVPNSDKSFGWLGLTGGGFDGINCSVIHVGYEDYMINTGYPTNTFIHEMAHGLEGNSNARRTEPIALLHSGTDYGYSCNGAAEEYKWYKAYYRDKIKHGKGIDASVYWKPSDKSKLVSDSMTTGTGINKG